MEKYSAWQIWKIRPIYGIDTVVLTTLQPLEGIPAHIENQTETFDPAVSLYLTPDMLCERVRELSDEEMRRTAKAYFDVRAGSFRYA